MQKILLKMKMIFLNGIFYAESEALAPIGCETAEAGLVILWKIHSCGRKFLKFWRKRSLLFLFLFPK